MSARLAAAAHRRMRALYSPAFSRIAWPPSASSWLTSPDGDSLRSTLVITCSCIATDQMGSIMSVAIIMSRPK